MKKHDWASKWSSGLNMMPAFLDLWEREPSWLGTRQVDLVEPMARHCCSFSISVVWIVRSQWMSECQQVALCCSSLALCSQCLSRMNPLDMMRISELPHKSSTVSDWKVTAANMTHSTFHSIISAHLLSSLLHSCSLPPLPHNTHHPSSLSASFLFFNFTLVFFYLFLVFSISCNPPLLHLSFSLDFVSYTLLSLFPLLSLAYFCLLFLLLFILSPLPSFLLSLFLCLPLTFSIFFASLSSFLPPHSSHCCPSSSLLSSFCMVDNELETVVTAAIVVTTAAERASLKIR